MLLIYNMRRININIEKTSKQIPVSLKKY
jgi:hypothetical protein